MAFKLNYRVVGREEVSGDTLGLDHWNVEWTHADGPVKDYEMRPKFFDYATKKDVFEEVVSGERDVVSDLVSVPRGTPMSIVMQMCEEKRARLAANLRVEP